MSEMYSFNAVTIDFTCHQKYFKKAKNMFSLSLTKWQLSKNIEVRR